MPRASSRETISTGSPDRCSTTAPAGAGASERVLKTKTGFSPYGHLSKLNTVSKVLRPMTSASTLCINSSIAMGFTASCRQEVKFTIATSNEAIYADTDKDRCFHCSVSVCVDLNMRCALPVATRSGALHHTGTAVPRDMLDDR